MRNPFIKAPLYSNVVVFIVSAIVSYLANVIGFAHLFEGIHHHITRTSPDIPIGQMLVGWVFVLFLCSIGIITLLICIAIIKAIYLTKFAKH